MMLLSNSPTYIQYNNIHTLREKKTHDCVTKKVIKENELSSSPEVISDSVSSKNSSTECELKYNEEHCGAFDKKT